MAFALLAIIEPSIFFSHWSTVVIKSQINVIYWHWTVPVFLFFSIDLSNLVPASAVLQ